MSTDKSIIRACMLYEFKLGTKTYECYQRLIKAFSNDAVSEITVKRWFAKFRSGDLSIEISPIQGRPKTFSDSDLEKKVEDNPEVTCSDLASVFEVSDECIRQRLHRIGKVQKLNKWVPYELNTD